MNLTPYIIGGVLVVGLGAGWLAARIITPVGPAAPAAAMGQLRHGGTLAAEAVNEFESLNLAPPSVVEAVEAPPPPPDIAELFRRDLTAIETERNGRVVVWIVDDMSAGLRRRIARGQPYKDGWVVASISDQMIELRRRRERRQIAVFDPPNMDNEQ